MLLITDALPGFFYNWRTDTVDQERSTQCHNYCCTCFMYVRPTDASKKFMVQWLDILAKSNSSMIDQDGFNRLLQNAQYLKQFTIEYGGYLPDIW